MKNRRIYQPGYYRVGQAVNLSEDAVQHVAVVLRMSPGDQLVLFDGDNHEYVSKITAVRKNKVTVVVLSDNEVSRESPRQIHLAQSLSKGDRMEFVIQKGVELGVTSITPLLTQNSAVRLGPERLAKKILQWQAIAVSACEQSGRNQIPMVYPVSNLSTYLRKCAAKIKLVLCPNIEGSWRDYHFPQGDIGLLIGPEGGLSEEEVLEANQHQFKPLCLGPRVLRTETAALAALSVLQAVIGDL